MNPKISVLLPVYNAQNVIEEAVNSILNQTFTDFELLIFNDASIDKSGEILKGFIDPRIQIYHSEVNRGYLYYLNQGIKQAKGEYIARMDADDICESNRFIKQVEVLDRNKKIGVVGSFVKIFGSEKRLQSYPISNLECKESLLFRSCFAHPAVMIRKKVLIENDMQYDSSFYTAEDYNLWIRLSEFTEFYNINEHLLQYRISDGSISVQRKEEQTALKYKLQLLALKKIANVNLDEELTNSYLALLNPYQKLNINWVNCAEVIKNINNIEDQSIKEFAIKKLVSNIKMLAFYNTENGLALLKGFKSILVQNGIIFSIIDWIKLYIKAIFRIKIREDR